MRMEYSMGQMCNETVFAGKYASKIVVAKRRMASSEPGSAT